MKILLCDPLNTQNNFYVLAKCLRDAGTDAELVIGAENDVPKSHTPEWQDTELSDGYPDWVHRLSFPELWHPQGVLAAQNKLNDLARQFDLVVCSGITPIWVANTGVPFVFISYGSDLDQVAVQGWSGEPRTHFSLVEKAAHYITRKQLVQAIRKARTVVLSPYQVGTAKRLGLEELSFLPHLIDTELFRPRSREQTQRDRAELHRKLDCDIILFHPPRQVWTDRTLADCKGNDKVFLALADLGKKHKDIRVKLVAVNKGWDLAKSKELVASLGVADRVVWIDPVTKPEMCNWYRASDIVLDQFVVGVLALVAVEAMACGTPVMSYVPESNTRHIYLETPPVISPKLEQQSINNCLCSLVDDKSFRDSLSEQGRQWVITHCSPQKAVQVYNRLFHACCTQKDIKIGVLN